MAYCYPNYKTKKALKEAVEVGKVVRVMENTPGGQVPVVNDTVIVEGPHYPQPHKWYASCVVKNSKIKEVK